MSIVNATQMLNRLDYYASHFYPMSISSFTIQSAHVIQGQVIPVERGCYLNADNQSFQGLPELLCVQLLLASSATSQIRVEICLPPPAVWNGLLIGFGNGGSGGHLPTTDVLRFAKKGFAAVTTDLGTSPHPIRVGFHNPEVWKDFGHRASHLMTVVAKEIIQQYYGRPTKLSYFMGASTGGQQGLALAQRYPQDYQGICIGVPAQSRVALHAYFLWNYQCLFRPDGSRRFTQQQEATFRRVALAHFSARENLPQGRHRFIVDPRWRVGDLDQILDAVIAEDPSFTAEQLIALRKLQQGPRHARTGQSIFEGIPPAAAFDPAARNLFLHQWVFGEHTAFHALNFDTDYDAFSAALAPDLDAVNPNLEAFRTQGGKILMYSGTADSCVPYTATRAYYDQVVQQVGSLNATQDFFRYYILPGRTHRGGPGIQFIEDELKLLRAWCEKDIPPVPIGRAMVPPKFSLPLLPYPQCWN